jgi:hypothetical protein
MLTLLGALPTAQAEELGRLFYTPQQRTQLEAQQVTGENENIEGIKHNYIIVNGVVQKRGGNRIVWINGAPQAAGKSNEKAPATVPVTVPGKTQPVQLKVGQRLMLDTPAQSPAQNSADETKPEKTAPAKPVTEEDD